MRLFEQAPAVLEPLPGPLALPAGRRVPGHQPRAVPVDPRCSPAAHQNLAVVGDDDQSIYSLARRRPAQHPRLRARLPRRDGGQAGAELPLHPAHPRRRARGRLAQRGPQGQEALDGEPARRAHRAVRGRPRGRGGRADRAPGRGARGGRGAGGSVLARRADEGDERSYRLQDIAVMYRTNAQSRAIEEAFLRYGLRYQLVGGTRFYQRREVKDALAYLRTAAQRPRTWRRSSASSTCPPRGIGDKTIAALREPAAAREVTSGRRRCAGCRRAIARRPSRHAAALAASGDCRAPAAHGSACWRSRAARRGPRGVGLPGDAQRRLRGGRGSLGQPVELREVVARYADLEPEDALDRLLEETALVADQDAYEERRRRGDAHHDARGQGPRVRRRLHHRAGGGRLPALAALDDPRQMEEERRLAYVGITRARHRLYLTHAAQRATWGRGGFSVPAVSCSRSRPS